MKGRRVVKPRTVVVEIETAVPSDELVKKLKSVELVLDASEYEDPLVDVLRDVGLRLWKLERRDTHELADIRRDVEAAIGEDFGRFPKSWV